LRVLLLRAKGKFKDLYERDHNGNGGGANGLPN
jgi:hypothetical protein